MRTHKTAAITHLFWSTKSISLIGVVGGGAVRQRINSVRDSRDRESCNGDSKAGGREI
jgi:hypothetical protein